MTPATSSLNPHGYPPRTRYSAPQDEVRSKGDFEGFFFRGFSAQAAAGAQAGAVIVGSVPSVRHLEPPVYRVLLEIALDCLVRPSADGPNAAPEPFGKLIVRPGMLRLIFRALPAADSWQTRHDALKDLNVLLLRREENFAFVLEQADWLSWMAPLFVGVPRRPEDRSDVQSEFLKFVLNFFCSCLFHTFATPSCTGGDVDKQASAIGGCSSRALACSAVLPPPPPTHPSPLQILRMIRQLTAQCTWSDSAVSITRNILSSLLVKILQARSGRERQREESRAESAPPPPAAAAGLQAVAPPL